MLTAINKQLLISESHDDSNRCTPCMENLIQVTRTLPMTIHICHSYASCRRSPYMATFHEFSTVLDIVTAPEKKGLPTTSPARRLIDLRVPTQFLSPSQPLKKCRKPSTCWQQTISVYWAHISNI
jgi:hypothetical protein